MWQKDQQNCRQRNICLGSQITGIKEKNGELEDESKENIQTNEPRNKRMKYSEKVIRYISNRMAP